MRNHRGFALLASIFIVLVFAVLALGLLSLFSSESRMVVAEHRYSKVFYIAEAGKNFALKHVLGYGDWTENMGFPMSKSFSGGYFTLSTTDETLSTLTLYSTGIITLEGGTYTRVVRAGIEREGGLGSHTLYASGSITIGENATIYGDISATGEVNIGSGSDISGEVEENVPPPSDPPSLDTFYYDTEILTAEGTTEGNVTYNNETLSGTDYINGNLTFNNNAIISVTGTATVVATGTVAVNNNVIIGDNLTVIAGGLVTIQNNADIGSNGLWFSSVGFVVGNNAEVGYVTVGSGTVFITPGDIALANNAIFSGLLFAEGTVSIDNNAEITGSIIAGIIDIGNGAIITLDPGLVDYDSIIGLSGSEGQATIRVRNWSEVY